MEFSATLSGFEPSLLGGGLVDVAGMEPELNGSWHLKSVSHRLDAGGLITEFQAERGREG